MKRTNEKPGKGKKLNKAAGWAVLTWDDLDQWAGSRSVSRGRSYQNQGRVKDLAISADDRLLATVQGGDRYVVSVWLNAGKKRQDKIQSHCTCPVGYDCKHAVATVAAYLQALTDGATVPTAGTDDPRWRKLSGAEAEFEEDLDDWDDDDDQEDEQEAESPTQPPKRRSPARTRTAWDDKIERLIRGKSGEELADEVLSLIRRYPELREEYRERIALSEGDVDKLVAQARRELRDCTSEIGWQNHWQDEGYTPDYSGLKHRLERMVELGHSNAVVALGREFIERAMSQVEQSHDEGETAMAVAECLPVVFDAVVKSTLPGPEKILFAIEACLKDDYDVIGDSAAAVLDAKWKPADWSAAADELARRLDKMPSGGDDSWHRNYQRDRLSDWLLTALENAGRGGELLTVYESEARATGSYDRLVRHLIAEKCFDDAERWAREGIEKTREKLPGIASALAARLCEVSRGRKQWDIVAAHAAWRFFEQPGKTTFDELAANAAKAKCGEQVRAAALRFLETGASPFQWIASPKAGQTLRIDAAWPLPVPDYLVPLLRTGGRATVPPGPRYDVLLDMAIAAKQPDDVLRWYDKMAKRKEPFGGGGWTGSGTADRVAAAVAKSHPERALEIYRRRLDGTLPHAHVSAYESAAAYLKKMQPVMKSLGRQDEWAALVAGIREKYRNRPRFMEILDKLDGRTILQTQKARSRRR
ncbi:MAG: SWIM zinc finger family protein [Thermoguttaceae bacterium]